MTYKINKNFNSDPKNKKRKQGIFAIVNKLVIILIVVSGIGYIATINDLSIKGFVVNELKKEVIDLETLEQGLELSVTNLESYETINSKAQSLKMVKVDEIVYLHTTGDTVALR